jgi:2-polyprenyl-3-methyl-5-hydroxy-6-metoxy-1,4-benzoquinol methylase
MIHRIKRFFRRLEFERLYRGNPPWDTNVSPPELMAHIASHTAGRALDLGCGTGTNAITLARNGWRVVGVDFATEAITQARRKSREAGTQIDFRIGSVTNLNFLREPFDLILDIGCFHGLDEASREMYIQEVNRLLEEDGTWLLYAHLKSSANDSRGLTEADFASLSSRFRCVERDDGIDTSRGNRSVWSTLMR